MATPAAARASTRRAASAQSQPGVSVELAVRVVETESEVSDDGIGGALTGAASKEADGDAAGLLAADGAADTDGDDVTDAETDGDGVAVADADGLAGVACAVEPAPLLPPAAGLAGLAGLAVAAGSGTGPPPALTVAMGMTAAITITVAARRMACRPCRRGSLSMGRLRISLASAQVRCALEGPPSTG
jgi:hypothetical protein